MFVTISVFFLSGSESVSYTHLDVYKRQVTYKVEIVQFFLEIIQELFVIM